MQPLMEDLEQGKELTNFTDDKPKDLILVKGGPSAPKHETDNQKIKVLATLIKPESGNPSQWADLNGDHCIYRVTDHLRRVNPEAYTPQLLLIGPLQHHRKSSRTDSRIVDYMSMESCKEKYLEEFADEYGNQTVEEFRDTIARNEQRIRASYASIDWMDSYKFEEMILGDSVFILVFMMRQHHSTPQYKRDRLTQTPCLQNIILSDLMLLENQLPFALLSELFEPFFIKIGFGDTFRNGILQMFGFEKMMKREVKFYFRHFTDLFRHDMLMTLGLPEDLIYTQRPHRFIGWMRNADMLNCAGVDFVGSRNPEDKFSMAIKFQRSILTMPYFKACHETEKAFRNIMALEQYHYYDAAFVCNYIAFLNLLVDTDQDVDLLIKKGVIKNELEGGHGSVLKMMRQMSEGIVLTGSNYHPIAEQLNDYCSRQLATLRLNTSVATLRRVYFKDLWTGTASIAAVVIVILTLIGTVASVLQVVQKGDTPAPAPASTRRSLILFCCT